MPLKSKLGNECSFSGGWMKSGNVRQLWNVAKLWERRGKS